VGGSNRVRNCHFDATEELANSITGISMLKSILLARPHTFIVSEMKPFLEANGFSITKLESLGLLPGVVRGTSGAVISLAISSSIVESADIVFQQLRAASPKTPVLFASMLGFEQARPALEKIAKQVGTPVTIRGY
jgi:maleate cis-trans isomerase